MAAKQKSTSTQVQVRSGPAVKAPAKRAREEDEEPQPMQGTSEATLLQGMKKLAREKAQRATTTGSSRGTTHLARYAVDESRVTVVTGRDRKGPTMETNGVKQQSGASAKKDGDDDDESEEDSDSSKEEVVHPATMPSKDASDVATKGAAPSTDGKTTSAPEPDRPENGDDEDKENATGAMPGEPSFGELVAVHATDAVDVEAAFGLPPHHPGVALARPGVGDAQVPSAHSLATVLTQALKTNDVPLLETCLQTHDLAVVRATIQRLQSPLATTLLSRLAERMHRRPARAGALMVWIQWTLIAHGGYLAGQPDVMRQLAALHDVLQDRARGLQPLLALKGKLDLLDAQMQLRKSMQRPQMPDEDASDDGDAPVIYVEGQDESADSDDASAPAAPPDPDVDMVDAVADDDDASDEDDDEDDDDMPNGLAVETHETSEGSASDDEGFIDDEADDTDADTGEDLDDDDDDDEDEDDEHVTRR